MHGLLAIVSILSLTAQLCKGRGNAPIDKSGSSTLNALDTRDSLPSGYEQSPPYYPTPNGGWISSWSASYEKAAAVVANMTLAEKVNLTSGTGYISKSNPSTKARLS